jgi:hypothetical protein
MSLLFTSLNPLHSDLSPSDGAILGPSRPSGDDISRTLTLSLLSRQQLVDGGVALVACRTLASVQQPASPRLPWTSDRCHLSAPVPRVSQLFIYLFIAVGLIV